MVGSVWPRSRWVQAWPRYQDTNGASVASKLKCTPQGGLLQNVEQLLSCKHRLTPTPSTSVSLSERLARRSILRAQSFINYQAPLINRTPHLKR